jgi:hypothetical protein
MILCGQLPAVKRHSDACLSYTSASEDGDASMGLRGGRDLRRDAFAPDAFATDAFALDKASVEVIIGA